MAKQDISSFFLCLRFAQKLHFPHLSHIGCFYLEKRCFWKEDTEQGGIEDSFAKTCLFYPHFHPIIFMFCGTHSGFPNLFFKVVWKAALKWSMTLLVNYLTCSFFCITDSWLRHGYKEYLPMKNTVFKLCFTKVFFPLFFPPLYSPLMLSM